MAAGRYRFDGFQLDPVERRLFAGETLVELNSRYFDALLLLLQHPGTLLRKERFLQEVWRGIPVTDEVLTQCIKTLRRQLGDSAKQPRLIETVPKHGYRFIAAVAWADNGAPATADAAPDVASAADPPAPAAEPPAPAAEQISPSRDWRQCWLTLGAGTTGGGVAGLLGGVVFGFSAAAQAQQNGAGALSALLVLMALATLLGLIGAAGVVAGLAAARLLAAHAAFAGVLGGALGGLLVGALGQLIGQDALLLLFGHAPGDITGAVEGLLLGAAVGLGDDLCRRQAGRRDWRRCVGQAALLGAVAGVAIELSGGRLLGGSLAALAESFPDARLHLDPLGSLPGALGAVLTSALEGAWFSACLVGALGLARR
jgi:transcriptional regulator HilA, main transcriptional regulator of SPI1